MPDARGKKSAQVLSDESNCPTSLGRSDFSSVIKMAVRGVLSWTVKNQISYM